MDDTQIDELLTRLEEADPSDAPDLADAVTAALAAALDGTVADAPPGGDRAPDPEAGGGS